MKKVMVLTALMLFVAATSAFAASTYTENSKFILGSVTIGSGLLAASSVGPFHLIAAEGTTKDTTHSFTSIETPSTDIIKVSGSESQSTFGFIDFTGTIHSAD